MYQTNQHTKTQIPDLTFQLYILMQIGNFPLLKSSISSIERIKKYFTQRKLSSES